MRERLQRYCIIASSVRPGELRVPREGQTVYQVRSDADLAGHEQVLRDVPAFHRAKTDAARRRVVRRLLKSAYPPAQLAGLGLFAAPERPGPLGDEVTHPPWDRAFWSELLGLVRPDGDPAVVRRGANLVTSAAMRLATNPRTRALEFRVATTTKEYSDHVARLMAAMDHPDHDVRFATCVALARLRMTLANGTLEPGPGGVRYVATG